jgi:hypothetical protein
MEGDGKTRAAPPCRDNNGKGTPKATSVRSRWKKRKLFSPRNLVTR